MPGSIAEIAWVRLGGLEQWVMIRGENLANPVLILLHGGPGMSETSLFRGFNSVLERHYTVVYWDQRGAGKTFDPATPKDSMTVEQFLVDLDQLVDHVRERVGKQQVTLLGHSWGSQLGCLYAARVPDKVAVYVGCAQIGDARRSEELSYAFALDEARRVGNHKAERELIEIGPPPHDGKRLWIERVWVSRLEGAMRAQAMWKLGRVLFADKEHSIFEAFTTFRALRWTLDAMWSEVSNLNLAELVPALQMPAIFLLGRKDHWVPAAASTAYIDALQAPSKQTIWFEESGHEIFADEPDQFNATMIEVVLPIVKARAVFGPRDARRRGMKLGIQKRLALPYEVVLATLPDALKSEGFGVLTQIDVRDTLREKLGVEFRRYKILGACNPALAHRALQAELGVGVMLPCNVTAYEDGTDTVVTAIDPMETIATTSDALRPIAEEVRAKLSRALDRLAA